MYILGVILTFLQSSHVLVIRLASAAGRVFLFPLPPHALSTCLIV